MVNIKTLLDKATSSELSEPDWETILDIVEEIKQKNVSVKNAVKEFRKKLLDPNSTVVYYTLQVLDSVMKNCTVDVHKEILSQEFMGIMKSVVTSSRDGKSDRAIDKALELIGEWKSAFGTRTGYKAVNDVFGELEREGFFIPEPQVASAAFVKQAPEWVMGDRCHMCRQEFNRLKGWFPHHCRNCGKSVCTQCSTKRTPLAEFGIKQPTRVCDVCYKLVAPEATSDSSSSKSKGDALSGGSSDLPEEYLRSSLAKEPQVVPTGRSEENKMKEEDDLQLAIAMSLNEQDNKKKPTTSSSSSKSNSTPLPISTTPSAPPPSTPSLYSSIAQEAANTAAASSTLYSIPKIHHEQPPPTSGDSNLARYLDRGYWERRKDQQSSGVGGASRGVAPPTQSGVIPAPVNDGVTTSPLASTVHSTVQQFVKQMQEVSTAGGSVAADPIILSLYQTLNALHPQLLKQIDDVQQQKVHQEQLLHKINEAKTARAALNTMRREHQEKIKQQAEEQTLLARMQMEQKLALLRQQKQEQLVYQQSLQQKRLDNMNAKRQEYEQLLASQREQERQQLIVQEQQVLQRQFRDSGSRSPVHMQMQTASSQVAQPQYHSMVQPPTMAQSDPSSISLHTLALHDPTITHQAPPLPLKLDHNISADPGPASLPPPYQPLTSTAAPAFHTMPTFQQPSPPQTAMQSVYFDPNQAPPTGNHGDTSLWVNNPTPSLHLPPSHLQPPPNSIPSQQPSPVNISQPSLSGVGVAGGVAYSTHPGYQQQTMGAGHLPQQQLYQPPSNFGNPSPPTEQHVPQLLPQQQTILHQQLPGQQQPMSIQPLTTVQGSSLTHLSSGLQRQESGPPLISFD